MKVCPLSSLCTSNRLAHWRNLSTMVLHVHSTTQSTPDILHRSAVTPTVMQSLDKQLWQSRISLSTKSKLYNTCILPVVQSVGQSPIICRPEKLQKRPYFWKTREIYEKYDVVGLEFYLEKFVT